jgi:hypothetical protein
MIPLVSLCGDAHRVLSVRCLLLDYTLAPFLFSYLEDENHRVKKREHADVDIDNATCKPAAGGTNAL